MAGISSVDCIGPAFTLMRKRLFEPFRFAYWSRIAVLGLLAGELSSSGNGGGGGRSGGAHRASGAHAFDPTWITQHWNVILWGIAGAFAIGLLLFYVGSVLRFVLYEAVLRDKARIREGFARWKDQGFEYFSFRLMLVVPYAALAIYLVGLPVLKIIKAGGGGPEIVTAIAQLIGAVLTVVLLGIMLAVVLVLTKDFVVPQMMFEGISCVQGWGRLWPQIKADPMSFVAYILLKIGLAIVAAIAFVIGLVILAVVAAIPLGIAGVAGVLAFKAVGGGALAIAGAVLLALFIGIPAIIYCVGFVGAPITVFFPAYSIYFFASRYRPLYDELYPQPATGD